MKVGESRESRGRSDHPDNSPVTKPIVRIVATTPVSWAETALRKGRGERKPQWTDSVAVGGRGFVEQMPRALGRRGRSRAIEPASAGYVLRDTAAFYDRSLAAETASPRRGSA